MIWSCHDDLILSDSDIDLSDDVDLSVPYDDFSDVMSTCQIISLISLWL